MRPGYQEGSEPMWWWKVAQHLDEAQLSLSNAMAHNVDDPRLVHALHGRLREGQAILLEIFRAKGLIPSAPNGTIEVPAPSVPDGPFATDVPVPTGDVAFPADVDPPRPHDPEESAVAEVALPAVASEVERLVEASATNGVAPATADPAVRETSDEVVGPSPGRADG